MVKRIIPLFLILFILIILLMSIFLVNINKIYYDEDFNQVTESDFFNQESKIYLISDSFKYEEYDEDFLEFDDFEEPEQQTSSHRNKEKKAECLQNTDCGINDFFGETFCQDKNDDVYQNYKIWTCENPRTRDSSCSFEVEVKLTEQCLGKLFCSEGMCI